MSTRNVSQLMRGGRARWKIANETCNTLKNQGDNFEHTYGHGEQNLSVVCATMVLLAFLVDQTQQLCCAFFRAVWAKLGSKRLLWERLRALFYDYHLESMREVLEACVPTACIQRMVCEQGRAHGCKRSLQGRTS